jgi:Big-like domain-containing protein
VKNRVSAVALIAMLALVVLSGCFSTTGVPLAVVSVSPVVGAEEVLIDASITVATSAELDELTVTAQSVLLLKGVVGASTIVAAEVTVTSQSMTIVPMATLDFGTQYTVLIAGTVSDVDGNLLEGEVSWSFTTRPLLVSVSTTGGQIATGARVTVDGVFVGTTNSAGDLAVKWPSGETASIAADKKLFIPTSDPSIPLDGSSYDAQLEVAPYIFVPDRYGASTAVPKISRLDAVDADPATYTTITSVDYGSGPTNYPLTGPRWVEVDYENGVIYVVDAPGNTSASFLIRMTNFPPAADGSDAEAVSLTDVYGAQQIHGNADGSIVLVDFRFDSDDPNYKQGRLVQIPADLNYASAVFGPWNIAHMYGVTRMSSGQYLTIGGDGSGVDALLLDDISDLVAETFGSITYGTGDDQMQLPSRAIAPGDGSLVYISDTGIGGYQNDRIVRYSSAGAGFAAYGVNGSSAGQFDRPVILGLLPDNKLYIMDVGNSRLARIDPGVFDGGSADWTESDAAASFSFDYWYNYS